MTSRTHRLLAIALLPLVAFPLSAAAQARKARPAVAARKPLVPNTSIIPLPLNPIVPAAQRLCTAKTPSGLGYTMLRAGSGAKPADSDLVLVNYLGYLATTGAVFDQGMRAAFPVGGVIRGFTEGLRMMSRTGVMRLCIPAALGYGAEATGPIPANADLVFQVELLDFRPAARADASPDATASEAPAQEPAPKP